MASARLKFGLQLISMCLLLCGTFAQRNSQRKEELIQDTVRKFLGVKSDERTSVPGKSQSLPPRYMMDLYEKYRSGQTPMQGNTVRSILAMRDKINGIDMLVFNLTGLKSTEQILQSKLYLLKRRKPKGGKKREHTTFRLNIGCLPDMASKHPIDISLSRQKPEWHSYDISESVVTCRQIRKGSDSLLGLTLEIKRPKGNYRLVAFKRLVKPTSQPFVLIFSEDSQNQSTSTSASKTQDVYGEIGDLLRAKANEEGILPETYRLPKTSGGIRSHRGRRSSDMQNYTTLENFYSIKPHLAYLMINSNEYFQKYLNIFAENYDFDKNSRSDFIKLLRTVIDNVRYSLNVNKQLYHVHKNELLSGSKIYQGKDSSNITVLINKHPSNLIDNETLQKVLFSKPVQKLSEQNGDSQTEKETLHSKKRTKRTISDTLRYSTEVKESNTSESTVNTIEVINEDYIQSSDIFPKSRRRNRKKKVNQSPRRHKKKRRRNRKLPFWWTRHDSRLHAPDMKQMCKRKSLMVDFSQLGWDDWIISPKSFNAHFCEGSCTFPIIKHTETSNHAAVQSLIHAMGLNTNVPTPSCVPSTTSSLTLLYFDEHGGLVLKSYPNMIVEKCGCR